MLSHILPLGTDGTELSVGDARRLLQRCHSSASALQSMINARIAGDSTNGSGNAVFDAEMARLEAFSGAADALVERIARSFAAAPKGQEKDAAAVRSLRQMQETLRSQLDEIDDLVQYEQLTLQRKMGTEDRPPVVDGTGVVDNNGRPESSEGVGLMPVFDTSGGSTSSGWNFGDSSGATLTPPPGRQRRTSLKHALERDDRDELLQSGRMRRALELSPRDDYSNDVARGATERQRSESASSKRADLLGDAQEPALLHRRNKQPEKKGNTVQLHKAEQESLTGEMAELAASLKANSQNMSGIVKRDVDQLSDLESKLAQNKARIDAENARLAEQLKHARSWTCKLWLLLFLVIVMFMTTYLFIKLTRRR